MVFGLCKANKVVPFNPPAGDNNITPKTSESETKNQEEKPPITLKLPLDIQVDTKEYEEPETPSAVIRRWYAKYDEKTSVKQHFKNWARLVLIVVVPILISMFIHVAVPLLPIDTAGGFAVYSFVVCPMDLGFSSAVQLILCDYIIRRAMPHWSEYFYLYLSMVFSFGAYESVLYLAARRLLPFNTAPGSLFIAINSFLVAYFTTPKKARPDWKLGLRLFATVSTGTVVYLIMFGYMVAFASASFWVQNVLVMMWNLLIFLLKQALLVARLKGNDVGSAVMTPGFWLECYSETMMTFAFPNMSGIYTMALYVFTLLVPDLVYPFFFTEFFWHMRTKYFTNIPVLRFFFSRITTNIHEHRIKVSIFLFMDLVNHVLVGTAYISITLLLNASYNATYFPYMYYDRDTYLLSLYSTVLVIVATVFTTIALQFILLRWVHVNMLRAVFGSLDEQGFRIMCGFLNCIIGLLSLLNEPAQMWYYLDPQGFIKSAKFGSQSSLIASSF